MIELIKGFWVDPWEVKIVKKVDDKSCLLYVTGEGAMDGHLLEYAAEEVVQAIEDAREECDDGGDEEEEDEDDQDEE